jgi:hypothetical protein
MPLVQYNYHCKGYSSCTEKNLTIDFGNSAVHLTQAQFIQRLHFFRKLPF